MHKYEKRLRRRHGTGYVYSYAGKILFRDDGFPQNFSTQKITRVFIMAVIAGWLIMAGNRIANEELRLLSKAMECICPEIIKETCLAGCMHTLLFFLNGVVLLLAFFGLRAYFRCRCRSSLCKMKKGIWK